MFHRRSYSLGVLSLFLAVAGLVEARDQPTPRTLRIGDSAPRMQTGRWTQGEPVTKLQSGTAYMVEFWATWCTPCRAAIPHVEALHRKYSEKGLVVIGQNIREDKDSLVAPFVKKLEGKASYRIALDDKQADPDGFMRQAWYEAAGSPGIPFAIVIDRASRVAWMGYTPDLTEGIIEDVLAGRTDYPKAEANYEKSVKIQKALEVLEQALGEKKWTEAKAQLESAQQLLASEPPDRYSMARQALSVGRCSWWVGTGEFGKAKDEAGRVLATPNIEPGILAYLGGLLIGHFTNDPPGMALSTKLVERAHRETRGEDCFVLSELARVQFVSGRRAEAIQTQERAVAVASEKEPELAPSFREALRSYQAGKLPQE